MYFSPIMEKNLLKTMNARIFNTQQVVDIRLRTSKNCSRILYLGLGQVKRYLIGRKFVR